MTQNGKKKITCKVVKYHRTWMTKMSIDVIKKLPII